MIRTRLVKRLAMLAIISALIVNTFAGGALAAKPRYVWAFTVSHELPYYSRFTKGCGPAARLNVEVVCSLPTTL